MAAITSPLAKSLQGGLVQRVSGSTFGGGRGITPLSSPPMGDDKNSALLETNTETLTTISASLSNISSEIRTIRDGINIIGERLAAESSMEQAAARADAEYQKRLAERQIRATGEQELENKIQAALGEPVKRIQNKVSSVFGNVMNALSTLFFGWLTIQVVDAIQAYAEGNTEKLKQIGANVLKTFAFLIGAKGAFSLLKIGILKVVNTMGSLTARVGKFVISRLFIRPFETLINAIRNRWNGIPRGPSRPPTTPPPSGPPGGPKGPKGGKGPGIFGASWAIIESFMNLKNQEYVDAIMPIVAAFGPGKFIRGLFAAGYAADQIAEVFGTNIFGKDPNKEKEAKQAFEEESKKGKESQAQTAPVAQPQTPMMGEKKDDAGKMGAETSTEPTQEIKFPSSGVSAPSGMESSTSSQNVQPQTPLTPTANSLSLGSMLTDLPSMEGTKSQEVSQAETASSTTPAEVTPIPSQSAEEKKQSLGPESKKPTTVIAQVPTSSPSQRNSTPPGAGTDVPKIRSSNPDNFYALYSQFNYNVVT
jgi:hypothetical protein